MLFVYEYYAIVMKNNVLQFGKTVAVILLFCFITPMLSAQMRVGAERTELYFSLLANKRVAICGNQTSMVGSVHLLDTLLSENIHVTAIFCPEHGFRGEAEAGAVIQSSKDMKTGVPIYSLYGKNKKPTCTQLEGVDILLFDMQDVGCRFYTYISTLHYVMEAAVECGVEVLILDRPNPNGYYVAGPVLDKKYTSFIGMHPVPIVHGMTMAEYGRMINGEGWLPNGVQCQLNWIPVENYTHSARYSVPIPPSPNLPTDEAINLYPSLCLFEGTDISIGRGTDFPFQVFGAPDLKYGDYFFTPQPMKGVSENPPHKGEKCKGVNLTEKAKENQLSIQPDFTLSYLISAYQHHSNPANFFTRPDFFDKLIGNSKVRKMIVDGMEESAIVDSWKEEVLIFKTVRKKYLLYPDFE